MFGIIDLGVFVAGTIAIVLLPGPNSIYVLTVSTRCGLKFGYAGALGVFLGDALLMLLTALGAASVLQANPYVYAALRWSGAAYLSYLGIKLIIGAWCSLRTLSNHRTDKQSLLTSLKPVTESSVNQVFRKALVVSLLNPKAILFFLSFFVQFVDPSYPHPGLSFTILGCIVQITSLFYLTALIFGGVKLAQAFSDRKILSSILSATVGLLFIGFGFRLAVQWVVPSGHISKLRLERSPLDLLRG